MKKYGCHNRAPLAKELFVPLRWDDIPFHWQALRLRVIRMRARVRMEMPYETKWEDRCHYDRRSTDKKCEGCKHVTTSA